MYKGCRTGRIFRQDEESNIQLGRTQPFSGQVKPEPSSKLSVLDKQCVLITRLKAPLPYGRRIEATIITLPRKIIIFDILNICHPKKNQTKKTSKNI